MNAKVSQFRVALLFLMCLFSLPADSPAAGERSALRDKEVMVIYDTPLRVAAEEVVKLYPELKGTVERKITWPVRFRPTVVLVKESATFRQMAGSDLSVAFAVPERNLMVIDYSKMRIHPFSLDTTLKHELCHLLLHDHIKEDNLPRWLDEGICQWLSDGVAEIMMRQRRSALEEATLSGRYIRIRALTSRFPREARLLRLAYEESNSFVHYLLDTYGKDGVLSLLNDLREGAGMDEAMMEALSVSLEELEKRWHLHLRKKITWTTYLIDHLYEILFFLAALALIYGFIRSLIRKRAYRDEEEGDDDGEP